MTEVFLPPFFFFFPLKTVNFPHRHLMWKNKSQLLAVEFFEDHGQKFPFSLLTLPKLQ